MSSNIKNILNSIFRAQNITLHPKTEWEKIATEYMETKELYLFYAIPFIALCATISAIGISIHTHNLWSAISKFFIDFLSLNIGLYFAAKIIILLSPGFNLKIESSLLFKLVIYSASVFCFFHGFAQLFPLHSFPNQISLLLELYFIRILWLGTNSLLPIAKNKRPGFAFIASLLILVLPLIFERMFSILFKLPLTI